MRQNEIVDLGLWLRQKTLEALTFLLKLICLSLT